MKKLFSISLILSVFIANSVVFSSSVLAYEKNGVDFEQFKTGVISENSGVALNKISSSSEKIKSFPSSSSLIAKGNLDGGKNYVEGEVLVKYKNSKINLNTSSGRATALNFIGSNSLEMKEDLRTANISVLKIKDGKTVEQKVAELKNDPNVEYAQPNFQYYPLAIPTNINTNDTYKTSLWGLDNTGQSVNGVFGTSDADIDAPEAWAINEGTNASVIVAVIDSGVAYNHPDLLANMWDGTSCKDENGSFLGGCNHGYDYEDGDNTPLPTNNSHGTHIAGTIAAAKNNSKGIIGVAPQAKIMAIKSSLTTSNIVKGINFAQQNGAKVINASWSGPNFDQALKDAIALFPGLFIAAAGNEATNNENLHSYPSDYSLDNIISVAATDQNDSLTYFSNYGATSVDVGAPGTNIYSMIADSNLLNEAFEEVTPPAVPGGWIKENSLPLGCTSGVGFSPITGLPCSEGNWGTYHFSLGNVLYGDLAYPYANNVSATIASPTYNFGGSTGANIDFQTRCDTEYASHYTGQIIYDYMALEYSSDGVNFNEIIRWDEPLLDDLIGDSDPTGISALTPFSGSIPAQYLTSNFKFRFRWVTDSSINSFDGCWVDDIKITKFSDGSDEQYGYMDGTSMAAPHVAGLAALIEGYNPNLTSLQVKNTILATGDSLASLSGKTVSGRRINVQKALQAVNPAKAITTFDFTTPTTTGVINEADHTIAVTVPSGTDITALVPTIVIIGASISPLSGVVQDFTNPVAYTVTAADGSTQNYVVTVTVVSTIPTITIGTQTWMQKNLNVGAMINGSTNQVNNGVIEKYCYNNNQINCNIYGGLYQWNEMMQYYTVEGVQGICPSGFHIPTNTEWKTLEMFLGMTQAQADATEWRGTDQGTQLKSNGSSGFDGLLGGYNSIMNHPGGNFGELNSNGSFWTSSQYSSYAWLRYLYSDHTNVFAVRDTKPYGFSVRCIQNNNNKTINAFSFEGLVPGTINEENHTIAVNVPLGTNVTALTPIITITGLSVSPLSGTTQNFSHPVTYTVTAGDSSTQAYVVTVTVVQPANYTISGKIKYYDGVKVVPNATVVLEDSAGLQIATTTTDVNGVYQFVGVVSGGDYVVRASKNDNAAGLTSNDQIKIGRHIVGLELFSTIYKIIAGDVNNSGGLTSNDQIKIGRFIVGIDPNLPSGAWKFYSSDANDTLTASNYLTFGLARTFTDLMADALNQDFVGVKMGDVNNSWVSN